MNWLVTTELGVVNVFIVRKRKGKEITRVDRVRGATRWRADHIYLNLKARYPSLDTFRNVGRTLESGVRTRQYQSKRVMVYYQERHSRVFEGHVKLDLAR